MSVESFALACKSLAVWDNLCKGTLARLGARPEAKEAVFEKVKAGKYDAMIMLCTDFDEDASETDLTGFDKYLAESLPMVDETMRLSSKEPYEAASAVVCPGLGGANAALSNEEWWTERFESEAKKYGHCLKK